MPGFEGESDDFFGAHIELRQVLQRSFHVKLGVYAVVDVFAHDLRTLRFGQRDLLLGTSHVFNCTTGILLGLSSMEEGARVLLCKTDKLISPTIMCGD
jgi:hypothetical protein